MRMNVSILLLCLYTRISVISGFSSKAAKTGKQINSNAAIVSSKGVITSACSSSSSNRKEIECEHFEQCPGCVSKNVEVVDILQSAKRYFSSPSIQRFLISDNNHNKENDFFTTKIPSPVEGWRTQAKLAVAKRSSWGRDGCIFGLYERGTHTVLPIPNCLVHHPSINQAIAVLDKATRIVRTTGYDEESGTGLLRYVQCQVERATGKVSLTLVCNADTYKNTQPELSRLVKELKKQDQQLWHSIWCHCNDGTGNNIFARGTERWSKIEGPEFMREPLPRTHELLESDVKTGLLYFSPLTFRQGNLDGFDVIAKAVASYVKPGSSVCELYAGVGILGLTSLMSAHYEENGLRWLRCSDENPANLNCFNRAVNTLPTEVTGRPAYKPPAKTKKGKGKPNRKNKNLGKVSYMVASATEALMKGQALGAEVLIVDPPRKGLDDEVVEQLCKPHNPKQPPVDEDTMLFDDRWNINYTNEVNTLIYVSCGFEAFTKDCDRLLSGNAGWKLESATGYILFPGSDHVETLAVFRRRGRQ